MAVKKLPDKLPFTGDDEADRFNAADPLALLIGFELDQQVQLQKAFSGPLELERRIGRLDAAKIADMEPEALDEAFRRRPALHRFPGNMARRVQDLAKVIARDYGNDASRVWTDAKDGKDLEQRLLSLPGIGEMKARTLIGILGRRYGINPKGWEAFAPTHMSLADVDSPESLAAYQAGKRAYKAALRDGAGEDEAAAQPSWQARASAAAMDAETAATAAGKAAKPGRARTAKGSVATS
jgi:uncharacterized HhH-GPD family protein